MERKLSFYGTPLSRSLNNDQLDQDGPINARRARLNQQQTAKDSQGRQRFHGAFTGGFSAGYFNTVDTTAGFQPCQFVSHRGNKRKDEPSFSHQPEDYMDEEDLGEFGIAPKKIRVCNQYSNEGINIGGSSLDDFVLQDLMRPTASSIGELILKRMSSNCDSRKPTLDRDIINCPKFAAKNNFHGLGYKPLEVASNKSTTFNPLTAVLGSGQRLKISGEAFGVGVLDDDEDFLTTDDTYGYDHIGNYEFSDNSRSTSKPRPQHSKNDKYQADQCQIPGFTLAKQLDAIQICDDILTKYPIISIADDWKMPVRVEPYIQPANSTNHSQQLLKLKINPGSCSFNKKFIGGSEFLKSDIIDNKAGLVLYSDLKVNNPQANSSSQAVAEFKPTKATITRRGLEWRPCSLLCKRFDVPNPYPDNAYSGVKPSDLIGQEDHIQAASPERDQQRQTKEIHHQPASLELKRAVFDVTFTNHFVTDNYVESHLDKTDSEDEPQVVAAGDIIGIDNSQQPQAECREDDATDQDVIEIVTAAKREPEVIVLSSTSSSSSPSSPSSQPPSPPWRQRRRSQQQQSSSKQQLHGNDECHLPGETALNNPDDTYGPPLPPSLQTLIDLDHRKHYHRSRLKHKKKKKKRHKRSKRCDDG